MKEIKIQVPRNQTEVIDDLVSTFNLRSSKMHLENEEAIYTIKIEDNRSNNLLHEIKARGVGDVFGEISVTQLSMYISSETQIPSINPSSAANIEEILADIQESAVLSGPYVSLIILSGLLAAFGLISNSVVIIIGSMIVAPLLGPVALTSIGFLMPERDLLRKGIISESVGIILTILSGYVVGLIWGFTPGGTPQMVERAGQADPLNVAFAVVSGIAAGVIISRGQSISIVGVAIAASLAPPAANIGLYLAKLELVNAGIAASLLLLNIFAINAACAIMFSIFRLPAKSGMSKRRASKVQKTNILIMIATILAFIALAGIFNILKQV